IGSAVACCRGAYRSPWRRRSALRRWRMLWLVTASRTSSIPTRARSSLARPSPACSPPTALRSAWTVKGLGETTFSSSACGAASKYEEVYRGAYESVSEARTSIGRYLDFYNGRRPHSSLDGITPDQAYFTPLPLRLAD